MTLTNVSSFTVADPALLTTGSTFNVPTGKTMTLGAAGGKTLGASTITGAGTLALNSAAKTDILTVPTASEIATIDNILLTQGVMKVTAANQFKSAAVITTTATNSTLDLDESQSIATLQNAGTLDILTGKTLTQTGTAASTIGGVLAGAGTYEFNGAQAVTWGPTLTGHTGAVTLTNVSSFTVADPALLTTGSTFNVPTGKTMTLGAAGGKTLGASTITGAGTLALNSAAKTDILTVPTASEIATIDNILLTQGVMKVTAANQFKSAAVITTTATNSTLDLDESQSIATLQNAGTLDILTGKTLTQTGTAASTIGGVLAGAGTYEFNGAQAVTWGPTLTGHTGAVTLTNVSSFTVADPALLTTGSTFNVPTGRDHDFRGSRR